MKKLCLNCGQEFEAARPTAQFHSPACRVAYNRKKALTPDPPTKPDISETAEGPKPEKNSDPWEKWLRDRKSPHTEFISSGFAELDALTGGFPRGLITHIYGKYGVGKTTIMLRVAASLSRGNLDVLYFDVEAGAPVPRLKGLGINPDHFHLESDMFIEDLSDKLLSALGHYDAIIVDSLAALSFRSEAEGDFGDYNVGRKGMLLSKLMRLVPPRLHGTKTALIFTNQLRDSIGSYGPPTYTPGGDALKYASSLSIQLSTTKAARFQSGGHVAGQKVTARVDKSRVSPPFRTAEFKLWFEEGDRL